MAVSNTAKKIRDAVNPFKGMTLAQMKKKWREGSTQFRKDNAKNFAEAAKTAPKSKPKPKATTPPPKPKAAPPKTTNTKRGSLRPSNPPSPTVRKRGSNTGATVDPRERSVRRNLRDVGRNTTKGRKNISAQVKAASGSSKMSQKEKERRQREARRKAMKKNRREYLASKFNR